MFIKLHFKILFLFLFILLDHSDKLLICFGLFLKTFRVVLDLIRSWNNNFTSHFSFIQKWNNLFMSTLKTQIKKGKNNFYQIHKKKRELFFFKMSNFFLNFWDFRITMKWNSNNSLHLIYIKWICWFKTYIVYMHIKK